MPRGHTHINLLEVADAAQANGFGHRWEARVAREDARAFEAGPGGLELIAFGPHREPDGELVRDSWVD